LSNTIRISICPETGAKIAYGVPGTPCPRNSRGHALLARRDYVTPHDVKTLARDVMRHRIMSSYEADAEGLSADDILGRILDHIPVP
jgi:hypothetical protein